MTTNNVPPSVDLEEPVIRRAEGGVEPLAYVVRDAEGGSLHDFTDYYSADQFWIRNSDRMLKPQFLFCYDTPKVVRPVALPRGDAASEAVKFASPDELLTDWLEACGRQFLTGRETEELLQLIRAAREGVLLSTAPKAHGGRNDE